jgi:uncharacterized membrane protein (UPF0127 family)
MVLKRFAACAIVILLGLPALAQTDAPRERLVVSTAGGERELMVEIADDPVEMMRGLMYRLNMDNEEGMLFIYPDEAIRTFWMRNTYISLDIIFIKADGTIDSIAEHTTPLSERIIPSEGPSRFVLEINAGQSDALGIEPGDRVSGPAIESRQ